MKGVFSAHAKNTRNVGGWGEGGRGGGGGGGVNLLVFSRSVSLVLQPPFFFFVFISVHSECFSRDSPGRFFSGGGVILARYTGALPEPYVKLAPSVS